MELRVVIKFVITAAVVVAVSEIARRSRAFGALVAALPLTSLLALSWLWLDTGDRTQVRGLSMGIFWAVIPSLLFFVVLAGLMRTSLPFGYAMLIAIAATVVAYLLYLLLLRRFGIEL